MNASLEVLGAGSTGLPALLGINHLGFDLPGLDLLAVLNPQAWLTSSVLPFWAVLPVLFLMMALPMGPAEPTAAAAGLIAGAPMMPLWAVLPVVAAGMLAGDLLAFTAAGSVERCVRRRGRSAARLEAWQDKLQRHPRWRDTAVAGLRFVPGARTPAALAARTSGIGTLRFGVLVGTGSLVWACLWAGAASTALAILR